MTQSAGVGPRMSVDSPDSVPGPAFEEFVDTHRHVLLAYFALTRIDSTGEGALRMPRFREALDPAALEKFRRQLVKCMPRKSMMLDLWDWNEHFEEDLGDEWVFEAVFGTPDAIPRCAGELAMHFRECVDSHDIDYNQHADPTSFESMVTGDALAFVTQWRASVFAMLAGTRIEKGG